MSNSDIYIDFIYFVVFIFLLSKDCKINVVGKNTIFSIVDWCVIITINSAYEKFNIYMHICKHVILFIYTLIL